MHKNKLTHKQVHRQMIPRPDTDIYIYIYILYIIDTNNYLADK